MQEDIFPAAEKILSDIENVVKKDSSLKSFEIIPAQDNENKSPVFHQEECLGLASWCVQPLYCYSYRRLLELRQNKHRREEPSTVARWLLGALLLNPDVSTFWNMRRELVRCHKLDPRDELSFSRLVLYHKPKCFEAFAYRRWLLPYVIDAREKGYDPPPEQSSLCAEIEIAGTCADRYANNYHAWSHRRYVMALRESQEYTHPSFESEWKTSQLWCERHVSDYSGFAYRQFLLKKGMSESKATVSKEVQEKLTDPSGYQRDRDRVVAYIDLASKELRQVDELQKLLRDNAFAESLDAIHGRNSRGRSSEIEQRACFRALSLWAHECQVNEDSIRTYNDHEALWYHRRYLAHLLTLATASYKKYSHYKAEVLDCRPGIRPHETGHPDETVHPDEDLGNGAEHRGLVVDAFRNRNRQIVEFAAKRSPHEKTLAKKFVQFLAGVGLDI